MSGRNLDRSFVIVRPATENTLSEGAEVADDDDDDDDSPIQQCARRQLLQKAPKHLSHLS